MKKLSLALCLILVSTASWAVKAYPEPTVVTQSDGSQLTVIGYGGSGDKLFEKSHAFASPVTVARNTIYPIPNIQIN